MRHTTGNMTKNLAKKSASWVLVSCLAFGAVAAAATGGPSSPSAGCSNNVQVIQFEPYMNCQTFAKYKDVNILAIVKNSITKQYFIKAHSPWTQKTKYIPMVQAQNAGGLLKFTAQDVGGNAVTVSSNDLAPNRATILGMGPAYLCQKP